MIKTKPPRPKTAGGDGGADKTKSSGGAGAAKKRRPSQKKKETADSGADASGARKRSIGGVVHASSSSASASAALHQEEHRRYYKRAPRLLPEIDGVRALSASEVSADLKLLQSSLAAFETKLHALAPSAPGSGTYLHGTKTSPPSSAEDAYAFLQQHKGSSSTRRLARATGVITPEEVVESLPVCRRAVRITQRELAAMKRERDDLERDFMRQRCKLLWQMGEMKRIHKQHERALAALSGDVVRTAKSLASSRRRTTALQDIMTELDARGRHVVRLTREKRQLEALLKKHAIALPEPDEIYEGDRVACGFGEGRVAAMDDTQRTITVALDRGGVAYVQEDTVEVLPSEIAYTDAEKELKAKLFEKIGALVQPNGRFSFLASGGAAGRRRSRGGADDDDDSDGELINDVLDQADANDDDDDDDDDDETMENGTGDADEDHTGRRSAADGDLDATNDDENRKRPAKKRKLMVPPASSAANAKKKQKNGKVFDFTACKIPITPYDVGLLLSPLSVLPERVAAVGPDALQWLSSYLPAKMADWEQDRYHALQMQGEIERLRFQLQKAEDDKQDAHTLAVEQVDSMNDLVRQIEKLREQLAAKEAKEKDGSSGCANCNNSSSGGSKKGSTTSRQAKSNGRSNKSSNRRQRSESTEGDDEDTEGSSTPADKDAGSSSNKKSTRDESDAPEDSDARKDDAHGHEDDDFGDDGGESSDASKPAARSLRPRRGSGNSTTSQSSNATSHATSKASK